jgi:hypothetical protein
MGRAPPSSRSNKAAQVTEETGRRGRVHAVWLPAGIILAGALLRIAYASGSDVRNVYDDHFQVTRIILEQHRWPHPDENWQAYQPPLYHALSALTYWLVSGRSQTPPAVDATPEQWAAPLGLPCPYPWHMAGRKAIQLLSVAAGIGVLLLVWLTLRLLFPQAALGQSAGLALVAFLPRHIYMSGMATNDSLAWLWASLCVYAVLRALPARGKQPSAGYGWWVLAGVAAALAMWTKHYGLGSLGVLGAGLAAAVLVKDRSARRGQWRGAALALVVAIVLGAWPYVRTYRLTGSPIVSNFDRLPNTMTHQMPGELSRVSWLSFRPVRLVERPWVHLSTVDSFWTSLYAESWFDFGTSATIYQYRPWLNFVWPIWRDRTLTGRERERRGLMWDINIMPARLLWEGRLLIALGLLPSAVTLLGLGALWRRVPITAGVVLMASTALGVATPAFQTVRQPFRSSMKVTFALSALLALAVCFVSGCAWLTDRRHGNWLRAVVLANLVLLAAVVAYHFFDLALVFPGSPLYFARRDPL